VVIDTSEAQIPVRLRTQRAEQPFLGGGGIDFPRRHLINQILKLFV
jgi:hypothetical protein